MLVLVALGSGPAYIRALRMDAGRNRLGRSVANEMEIEDGVIWVYGVGEDGVMAFTDFGIENLIELIKMYKDDPTLLNRWHRQE